MLRKLLTSCAIFALVVSPGYAAGYIFGGPGGTGVNGTGAVSGSGAGTQTAGCTATGGYQGPGDCLPSGVTAQRFYGTRAYSYAAAQAGAYLYRLYGSGGTGNAATTVFADVRAKADGTPDLANAVLSAGGTGSVAAGAGTATTNPCFGGDGTCRKGSSYDQVSQTSTASTAGNAATNATAAQRPLYYNTCSNFTTISNSLSKPCFASLSSAAFTLSDSSTLTTGTQPLSIAAVLAKVPTANTTLATLGGNIYLKAPNSSGLIQAFAGTAVNFSGATDPSIEAVNVMFNGANSLVQVNGTSVTSTLNAGTNAAASPITLLGQANALETEVLITTGTWTAAQQGALASNQSAYYGLGF